MTHIVIRPNQDDFPHVRCAGNVAAIYLGTADSQVSIRMDAATAGDAAAVASWLRVLAQEAADAAIWCGGIAERERDTRDGP